jgi:tartrate dehydrogenase/decarboxylase / D-malate dehydrogenase
MKKYEIAVIPGDGIGKEVVPVALHVLDAVSAKFGIGFAFRHFDWSCETYKATGHMMPEDGIARLRDHHAILLGWLPRRA